MLIVIVLIIVIIVVLYVCVFHKNIETFRDPLYMNQQKLEYDWYPRTRGSIYGMPLKYGGNYHMMTGYNFDPKAY